jgi:hypothetical protein
MHYKDTAGSQTYYLSYFFYIINTPYNHFHLSASHNVSTKIIA